MPPEQEVIETEQQVETAEPETSSPSETTETQTEETQAEETGEQQTTEEQPVEETKPAGDKDKTPEEKAKAREEFLKRQLEKKDKELAEERAKAETSPARQQELARQRQEAYEQEVQEYMDAGYTQDQAVFAIRKQEEKTRQVVASQMQPLTGAHFRSQYESIKKDLASDPKIVDLKAIEAELDKLAHGYEVGGQSFYLGNKTAVRSWALYIQGEKSPDMIKAAEERGRIAALKDRRIEGEVSMPKTTVTGGNTGGVTEADKQWAAKHLEKTDSASLEFARKLRVQREKADKERNTIKK